MSYPLAPEPDTDHRFLTLENGKISYTFINVYHLIIAVVPLLCIVVVSSLKAFGFLVSLFFISLIHCPDPLSA